MAERLATWFALLLVGVVLATSYWYAETLRSEAPEGGRIGAIDFFAQGVALTTFDALGRPRFRLFADRMTHFGRSDDADLEKPHLVSMRPDQPQVQVTARNAHAQNNAQLVELDGDVVVVRAADHAHPPMRLETDQLSVVPDDDHFWTSAPVRMTSGRSVLNGRGMDFDNVARRLDLRADVAGSFPPRVRP
jgi:lipopolysaccharide export system protein LptC